MTHQSYKIIFQVGEKFCLGLLSWFLRRNERQNEQHWWLEVWDIEHMRKKRYFFFKHKVGAPIFNFDFISVGKFYFISESAFEWEYRHCLTGQMLLYIENKYHKVCDSMCNREITWCTEYKDYPQWSLPFYKCISWCRQKLWIC